ncbi:MAG: Alpha/beta hydrolase family protein [candidate division BRC1 bacterium ADurb.BinA292]|nr:MAG: Alpha/beta hydrolase family protein [candidate division BRC1 bacterium ADurb.BinA292]
MRCLKHDLRLSRGLMAACLLAGLAAAAHAWEGFDHETWREIAQPEPPRLQTPQAGRLDLAPLLLADGGTTISTADQWEEKRQRLRATLQAVIGEPTNLEPVAPEAHEVDRHADPDFERIHLMIDADSDGGRIPAYLFLPLPAAQAPLPAVIVLHQTVAQGKEEPAGVNMSYDLNFAEDLARRGLITIAYDAPGFGERIPPGTDPYHNSHEFFRRHPDWSVLGRMNWDFSRIVDFLQTRPEVDPERIAVIGHSHGAYGGVMGAVFDPRVCAVVASCGINTFRADPTPWRWSHATPLLPRLGFFTDDIRTAPFDWHEVLACLAPRPFFYFGTLADDIFPNTDGLRDVFEQVRGVYALYDAPALLRLYLVDGPHSFPPDRQNLAYDWLERTLGVKGEPAHSP